MKEKIKKILNKKVIICITVPLLVLGVSFGGLYFYKNQQELNKNKDFVFDVTLTLKKIYDSRGLNDKEIEGKDKELEFIKGAYQMKTKIDEADLIMKKWENNENEKRRKIAKEILDGIGYLKIASDAYIRATKDYKKEDLAIFSVNLEEGRGKVFVDASRVVFPDDKIILSQQQKREVIEKIDSVFEEEIKNYKENKDQENFSQPQEIWAVILIRNAYANDLNIPKI